MFACVLGQLVVFALLLLCWFGSVFFCAILGTVFVSASCLVSFAFLCCRCVVYLIGVCSRVCVLSGV